MTQPDFFAAFGGRRRPPGDQLLRPSVGPDGDALRTTLATTEPPALSSAAIQRDVQGNLWMLAPEAFRYFLPAFLHAALADYSALTIFVSELVGALTPPTRDDVVQSLDRVEQLPPGMAIPPDTMAALRDQQLAWIESGTPQAMFEERFAPLTPAEGAAVLVFLAALNDAHGPDFFEELELAIDRHWKRYAAPAPG